MALSDFDRALQFEASGEDRWEGRTSPAYANTIGPFGGITAAQALACVLQHPACLGEPISMTINFAAALSEGSLFLHARPSRTNRSTQHWWVDLSQDAQTCATATVVTAKRRNTWGSSSETPMPPVPPANQSASTPWPCDLVVPWLSRYDMRVVEGGLPPAWNARDTGSSRIRLWVRNHPQRALDFPALISLCDVFLPRVWQRRPLRTPVGTVSLTTYFHTDTALLARTGTGFVLGQSAAHAFRDGYSDQSAHLWSEDGELLATTHQIVYFKE